MPILAIFFLAAWIAFGICWMVAAIDSRGGHVRSTHSVGLRIGLALIVILALRTPFVRGHAGIVHTPVLQGLGLALFLLGLAVAVWARMNLGKNWGMPMTRKDSPELVTTGPYRYVRHPIYSGFILAMLGTALALDLIGLIVFALVGAYFVYSATVEERTMTARFPAEYPTYKSSTKMLIPLLL
jgi:protein-S-isoprenylcysteine O-methyltransferase Ste14